MSTLLIFLGFKRPNRARKLVINSESAMSQRESIILSTFVDSGSEWD